MAFYREPTHVREPGELPEGKPVGGQLEEQVAGNDHLLGADGDGAALIDVSRAKRSVGSNKRNRARNRDLRDAGGLLGLCRGSAPTEREQGHEGRYKEGETPLAGVAPHGARSEEHTSELQSLAYLVCRLLLEKKKKQEREG